jgi:hypothetical protein
LIDAFEADWVDDPALTLISSIGSGFDEEIKKSLFDSVAPLVARAIPGLAKVAAQTAGNFIGINKDVLDATAELLKDESEEIIRLKLEEIAGRKRVLEHLKKQIAAHIKVSKGGKIAVIVDELDRCSPNYAIRLLERLKHLFNIDGVVFLMLWNRSQIKQTVEAFYGAGTDGAMYLDKFIDYPITIPITNAGTSSSPMERLLGKFSQSLDEIRKTRYLENSAWLVAISALLKLNARQSQRLLDWWTISDTRTFIALEAWLMGLKAKYPLIYLGIQSDDKSAHQLAANLLLSVDENNRNHRVAQVLIKLHRSYEKNNFDEKDHDLKQFCTSFGVPLSESIRVALRHIEGTFD